MLNNFYKDNASYPHVFDIFLDIEKGAYDAINEYTDQIRRNFVIGEMETYRIIDIQKVPVAAATYDLVDLLSTVDVIVLLDMEAMTMEERIVAWNAMEPNAAERIAALNITNTFIEFTAQTVYPFQGEPASPSFEIVSFDLYDEDTKFQFGIDYDIQYNKLYLLSERCSSKTLNQQKSFILRNIAIDYDTPSRYLGKNFNLPKYPDFSKDLYNDILANLTVAALFGPMIAGMEYGVDVVTGASGSATIYDKYSLNTKRQALWQDYTMTPFDFIIELPAEYSVSESLSDIIKLYIDTVKLSDTDYQMIFNSVYEDNYSRHISADDEEFHINAKATHEEQYRYRIVVPQTNSLSHRTNSTFRTEVIRGFARYEEATVTIKDLSTGQETVVNL